MVMYLLHLFFVFFPCFSGLGGGGGIPCRLPEQGLLEAGEPNQLPSFCGLEV